MTRLPPITRRRFAALGAAGLLLPRPALAQYYRIEWDDLIPRGVAYPEIIAEGEMDEENDTWRPVYDANATRFNTDLDGDPVELPGYIIPLELDARGVTAFLLVPYVGACIHVPPPPPNQLIYVTTETPWPSEDLWDAVWVSGPLRVNPRSTEIAEIGYEIAADKIEIYEI